MQKSNWKYVGLMVICLLFYAANLLFVYLYHNTTDNSIHTKMIQNVYNIKYDIAYKQLDEIEKNIHHGAVDDNLLRNISHQKGISYCIYRNDSILFWSSNTYDFPEIITNNKFPYEHVAKFTHAFVVTFGRQVNQYWICANILIRSRIITDNVMLLDDQEGLGVPHFTSVLIMEPHSPTASLVIHKRHSNIPLFGLNVNTTVSNQIYGYLIWACFIITLLIYFFSFILLNKQEYSAVHFSLITLVYWAVLVGYIKLNNYLFLFGYSIFSPLHYGSAIFNSMGELLIYTVFLYISGYVILTKYIMQYPRSLKNKTFNIVYIEFLTTIIFSVILYILYDLIINSNITIRFNNIDSVSIYSVLAIIIMVLWLVAFALTRNKLAYVFAKFFSIKWLIGGDSILTILVATIALLFQSYKLALIIILAGIVLILIDLRYLVNRLHNSVLYTLLVLFVLHNVLVLFLLYYSDRKQMDQNRILAEKVARGERMGLDMLTEESMENIDKSLPADTTLNRLLDQYPDINHKELFYRLRRCHFTELWKVYDLSFDIVPQNKLDEKYAIHSLEKKELNHIHYMQYYMVRHPVRCDYIALYPFVNQQGDSLALYIKLVLRNNEKHDFSKLNINPKAYFNLNNTSYAFFQDGKLQFHYGNYNYKLNQYKKCHNYGPDFYGIYDNGCMHYAFRMAPNQWVVVTTKTYSDGVIYLIYITYIFSIFLIFLYIINFIFNGGLFVTFRTNSLVYRMERFFIIFQMVTILAIIGASLYFISRNQYISERNNIQKNTRLIKDYLEKEIENWEPGKIDADSLNYLFMDLNNKVNVTIHFYNPQGFFIATSHPYLFAQGILSPYISPDIVFKNQQNELVKEEKLGNMKYLAGYAMIYNHKHELLGYIAVPFYESIYSLSRNFFDYTSVYINIYLIIIMLSSILFNMYSQWITTPLIEVRRKLKKIRLGKENEHIPYPARRNDEISDLIHQYNALIDELAVSAKKLAETEKELAWREMAKQIAHEIKNPLTPMKLSLQQLRRMRDSEHFNDFFNTSTDMLIEQIDNLAYIANAFSQFAKMAPTKLELVNIIDRLLKVLHLYNNIENLKIIYESLTLNCIILGDSEQLTQLFNNLIKNAIQAIPSDRVGVIHIKVETNSGVITISITDNGKGISEAEQANIFKPNFTTKSVGMGIGLCLVKNYVTAMKGEISLSSTVDVGTTFILKFPIVV